METVGQSTSNVLVGAKHDNDEGWVRIEAL
jgi:hypothetical protein